MEDDLYTFLSELYRFHFSESLIIFSWSETKIRWLPIKHFTGPTHALLVVKILFPFQQLFASWTYKHTFPLINKRIWMLKYKNHPANILKKFYFICLRIISTSESYMVGSSFCYAPFFIQLYNRAKVCRNERLHIQLFSNERLWTNPRVGWWIWCQIYPLHRLLPDINSASAPLLRSNHKFNVPVCKTNRFKNSFFMCNSARCFLS